jgi:hypothetical protein
MHTAALTLALRNTPEQFRPAVTAGRPRAALVLPAVGPPSPVEPGLHVVLFPAAGDPRRVRGEPRVVTLLRAPSGADSEAVQDALDGAAPRRSIEPRSEAAGTTRLAPAASALVQLGFSVLLDQALLAWARHADGPLDAPTTYFIDDDRLFRCPVPVALRELAVAVANARVRGACPAAMGCTLLRVLWQPV